LIEVGEVLSAKKRRWIEDVLVLYVNWLARQYASSTVGSYLAHVKAKLFAWMGYVSLESLGISFARVNLAVKILKKRKPVRKRKARGFTYVMMKIVSKVLAPEWRAEAGNGLAYPWDFSFRRKTVWALLTVAFQAVMRLNELAEADVATFANRDPIMLAGVVFMDKHGEEVEHPEDLEDPSRQLIVRAVVEMPPSKADPSARNPPLQLPMVVGRNRSLLCPCAQIWELIAMINNPPPVEAEKGKGKRMSKADRLAFTPLFRLNSRTVRPITMSNVMQTVRVFCAESSLTSVGLGTKAWRIGGTCRLQDVGASVPQIAAMGRWASNAHYLYARVNEADAAQLARQMLG